MHLRRVAVIVTVLVASVMIVVIAGVTFMGVFGGGVHTRDDNPAACISAVMQALERYERDGSQATKDYYNNPENINGQWYGVMIDENGYRIADYNPERRVRDPGERVDATGYFFGTRGWRPHRRDTGMEFILLKPVTGKHQKKHTWVVRRDDLIFSSGWYEK